MIVDIFLLWILPPVLGAIIGYVTNWLAIKMLFRPLREHRLFGVKVPFTPGLLPREKARIARSIGETVSRELLTEEVIKKRLSDTDLRLALEGEIRGRLQTLLDSEAGCLLDSLGAAREGAFADLVKEAWEGLLRSEPFATALSAALSSAIASLEDVPLATLLPPERAGDFAAFLLRSENIESFKRKLTEFIERSFGEERLLITDAKAEEEKAAGESFLGGLLPVDALEPLVRALAESLYRASVPIVEGFMRSPGMRRGLERSAMEIVRRAISRLNLVQRLIVGAAQYERNLAETMPDNVEDLIEALSSLLHAPAMAGKAADAAAEALHDAASEGASSLLRRLISRETALAAAETSLDALRDHGPAFVERAVDFVASRPDASLGGLLAALGLPAEELSARAAAGIAKALAGGGEGGALLARSISEFSTSLAAALRGRSLAELLGTDETFASRLAAWTAERGLGLISAEAGRIISGFDIERIVVEKIDGLDMLEVERIILSVASKELRWITILGGFLGGLLGFIQTLIHLIPGT